MIETILFDLDGTLADTAADLANALNEIRSLHNMPPMPFESIRPSVSLGGNAMINLAFKLEEGAVGFEDIRQQFLHYYRQNIAKETGLFEGMGDVLDNIEKENKSWGIVTNKPGWLSKPLLKELGLDKRAACVVCGDTLAQRKPHPAPILHACEIIGSLPSSTVYIGDAKRDIDAGRRAGTKTLIALYGYIDKDEDTDSWQANGTISHPSEINDRLCELGE